MKQRCDVCTKPRCDEAGSKDLARDKSESADCESDMKPGHGLLNMKRRSWVLERDIPAKSVARDFDLDRRSIRECNGFWLRDAK